MALPKVTDPVVLAKVAAIARGALERAARESAAAASVPPEDVEGEAFA